MTEKRLHESITPPHRWVNRTPSSCGKNPKKIDKIAPLYGTWSYIFSFTTIPMTTRGIKLQILNIKDENKAAKLGVEITAKGSHPWRIVKRFKKRYPSCVPMEDWLMYWIEKDKFSKNIVEETKSEIEELLNYLLADIII